MPQNYTAPIPPGMWPTMPGTPAPLGQPPSYRTTPQGINPWEVGPTTALGQPPSGVAPQFPGLQQPQPPQPKPTPQPMPYQIQPQQGKPPGPPQRRPSLYGQLQRQRAGAQESGDMDLVQQIADQMRQMVLVKQGLSPEAAAEQMRARYASRGPGPMNVDAEGMDIPGRGGRYQGVPWLMNDPVLNSLGDARGVRYHRRRRVLAGLYGDDWAAGRPLEGYEADPGLTRDPSKTPGVGGYSPPGVSGTSAPKPESMALFNKGLGTGPGGAGGGGTPSPFIPGQQETRADYLEKLRQLGIQVS